MERYERRRHPLRATALALGLAWSATHLVSDSPEIPQRHAEIVEYTPNSAESLLASKLFPATKGIVFEEMAVDRTDLFIERHHNAMLQYSTIAAIHSNKTPTTSSDIVRLLLEKYDNGTYTSEDPLTFYFYGSSTGGAMAQRVAQELTDQYDYIKVPVIVADSSPMGLDTINYYAPERLKNFGMWCMNFCSKDDINSAVWLAEKTPFLDHLPTQTWQLMNDLDFQHTQEQLKLIDELPNTIKTLENTHFTYIAGKHDWLINTNTAAERWKKYYSPAQFTYYEIDAGHAQCIYQEQTENCSNAIHETHRLAKTKRINTLALDNT